MCILFKMEYNYKKIICINCGKNGHEYKKCKEPVTSYGIINIDIINKNNEVNVIQQKFSTKNSSHYKIVSNKYPDVKCYLTKNINIDRNYMDIYQIDNLSVPYYKEEHLQKLWYYRNKIVFMMVSRKFSIGFTEFVRGKYDIYNTASIINLFNQMYSNEIKFIEDNTFDNILYYFSNRENEPKEIVLNNIYEGKYSQEYCESKTKFNLLKNSTNQDSYLNLKYYTQNISPLFDNPEWGFPKGRRNGKIEDNMTCACREFEEETGYSRTEYCILDKIIPIDEKMIGTNNVRYKHVYYLSLNNCDTNKTFKNYDKNEIGEIKWFTYEEANKNIRPYHTEKKQVLTKIYLFVLNNLIHNDCNI